MTSVHPLGVLLAFLFVVSLVSVLVWMLHPPAFIPAAAAKARRSVLSIKRILVPTIGSSYSERGVELACRLGEAQKAEILVAYVIEVQRTLPLGTPLPDAEKSADYALERASSIAVTHHLPVTKIIHRARLAGEEITRIAKDLDVDMIVLGIRSEKGLRGVLLGSTSDIVLRSSPCEVVIAKLPMEAHPQGA